MNKNVKDQLDRMKGLMNYGLHTENKTPYASVEFSKKGADGKLYGIVREGSKYYIKSCPSSKKGLVKEDYEYIGGFMNRKDNEFTSYANALKHFDLKMASLKEANAPDKKIVIESWNPDKNEMLTLEATDKMRREIERQRQIMMNASLISEGKACKECGCESKPFCDPAGKCKDMEGVEDNEKNNVKNEYDPVVEEQEVLGWNDNKEYMDKSHGTEIGDSQPFDAATARNIDDKKGPVTSTEPDMKNGVVESYHGTAMHDSQNQNTPEPGTKGRDGAKDVDEPFDESVNEAIEDFGDDVEDDAEVDAEGMDDFGGEEDVDFGDEEDVDFGEEGEEGLEGEEDFEDEPVEDEPVEDEFDDDEFEDDTNSALADRISELENMISKIAEKLGVDEFEDEELYDDEEGEDADIDVDVEDDEEELGDDDFDGEEDFEDEGFDEDDDDVTIHESRSYKRLMKEEGMKPFSDKGRVPKGNMNKLDDFGKHPAYQKKVMSLPPKDHQEFPGYYDMNDDSVRNDQPYGEKIGDGAPFEVDIEKIENAIAESINKYLGLKKK